MHFDHAVLLSLRVLAGLAGGLLLYAALFLYEDEQGRIQNKLEKWWGRLRDLQAPALRRHAAFMREVARSSDRGFERLFGERLFSEQALVVSLYYSMASYSLCVMAVRSIPTLVHSAPSQLLLFTDSRLAAIGMIVTLVALGTLPAFVEMYDPSQFGTQTLRPTWAPVVITTVWANLAYCGMPLVFFSILGMTKHDLSEVLWPESFWHVRIAPGWRVRMVMGGLLMLGGFACDVGFIAVTRWALRLISRSYHVGKIASLAVVNFLFGLLLVIGPLLFARSLSGPGLGATAKWQANRTSSLLMALGLSNSIDALAALVFFLLALTLLGHMIFWPLVSRPLYALKDLGIARRRKLFGAVGLVLLKFAGFKVPDLIKKIVETVAG